MNKLFRNRQNSGITLIALVVTIIVLLILAAVSINLVLGENGIITRAKQSNEATEITSIKEKAELIRNELEINRLKDDPQDLTRDSYINALNVVFDNSVVEGRRVILENGKYVIIVKSNLDVEVIKDDVKTLAKGELKLDYEVTKEGLIEIYPTIGGIESYKTYAKKILVGKTQEEKEQIFIEGEKYQYPDDYETIENPTLEDCLDSYDCLSIEELLSSSKCHSFDEFLIKNELVKPEGYNVDEIYKIEIECPNGTKLYTDIDVLYARYPIYQNGNYRFVGKIINTGVTDEITVPVNLNENIFKTLLLKLKINITEDNKTIKLPVETNPVETNYIYDFKVDWGDETEEQLITNDNLNDAIHTYANTGEYIISIKGIYESIYVAYENTSIKQALIEVVQWGTTSVRKIYLSGCSNLKEISSPNKNSFILMENFNYAFFQCSSLESIPQDLFGNCTEVKEFEWTFAGCTSLTSIPQELFDNCQKVTSFMWTFGYCRNLKGKSIHLWSEGRSGIDENNGGCGCYYMCSGLEDYDEIPLGWYSD